MRKFSFIEVVYLLLIVLLSTLTVILIFSNTVESTTETLIYLPLSNGNFLLIPQ